MCDLGLGEVTAMKEKIVDLETRVLRLERIIDGQALAWKKFNESFKTEFQDARDSRVLEILKKIPASRRSNIAEDD